MKYNLINSIINLDLVSRIFSIVYFIAHKKDIWNITGSYLSFVCMCVCIYVNLPRQRENIEVTDSKKEASRNKELPNNNKNHTARAKDNRGKPGNWKMSNKYT